MMRVLAVFCAIFAYGVLVPTAAQAYLLPLIGAGPAIIAMLVGVLAAVLAALYLVIFNIRRSLKKRAGKGSSEEEDEEIPDQTHKPS